MIDLIRSFISKCRRALAYAKLGYNNWDFDALTIEKYLEFKLKRVQHCLINGHCDLEVENGPKKMKALALCIKILEKLNKNDYNHFSNLHDKKWGELKMWTEPGESRYYILKSQREKATTPELIEQERNEMIEASRADARQEDRDRKLMYKLIEKYITYWWD